MNVVKRLWSKVRNHIGKDIIAKEPAIAAGIGGLAVSVATHYGLHLTAEQQTYITGGAFIILNWIVRQCVFPVTKAVVGDHTTTIQGGSITTTPAKVTSSRKPAKRTAAKRTARRS